jgi:hypothetical protein
VRALLLLMMLLMMMQPLVCITHRCNAAVRAFLRVWGKGKSVCMSVAGGAGTAVQVPSNVFCKQRGVGARQECVRMS